MKVGRRGAVLAALVMAAGAQSAIAQDPAPAPPALRDVEIPSSVLRGAAVKVTGRVAPKAAVPVALEYSADGVAWQAIGSATSNAAGRFGVSATMPAPGSLRVSALGADGAAVASAGQRYVKVLRKVGFRVTVMETFNISGLPFRARGTVPGAAPGERALIEGSLNGRRYRPIARVRIAKGRVNAGFTPPAGGRWRFRLVAAARPGIDNGGSVASQSIQVFPKNPHRVPASAPHYLVQVIHETQLYYYQRGRLVRVLPVVFGKPSTPTPVGTFAVYSKTAGPGAAFGPLVLWYHRGYGIHGTNQEYLLSRTWRYYSHGCTRNYNVNIRWLWPQVPVGTPVVNMR